MFEEISVYGFASLFTDPSFQKLCLYSILREKDRYCGPASEIPAELEDLQVQSIDTLFDDTTTITINVD